MTRTLLITMSEEDASTFTEDWLLDRTAPVLTGGYMEHCVTVLDLSAALSVGVDPRARVARNAGGRGMSASVRSPAPPCADECRQDATPAGLCRSTFPPSAVKPYSDEVGWSGPLRCVLSNGHEGNSHWNSGINWIGGVLT